MFEPAAKDAAAKAPAAAPGKLRGAAALWETPTQEEAKPHIAARTGPKEAAKPAAPPQEEAKAPSESAAQDGVLQDGVLQQTLGAMEAIGGWVGGRLRALTGDGDAPPAPPPAAAPPAPAAAAKPPATAVTMKTVTASSFIAPAVEVRTAPVVTTCSYTAPTVEVRTAPAAAVRTSPGAGVTKLNKPASGKEKEAAAGTIVGKLGASLFGPFGNAESAPAKPPERPTKKGAARKNSFLGAISSAVGSSKGSTKSSRRASQEHNAFL